MPKRFEDPILVPTVVLDELETVRESGETNMQDAKKVQAIATRLGYPRSYPGSRTIRTSTKNEYFAVS